MEEIQFNKLVKENAPMIYSIINDVIYRDFYSDYRVSEDDLFQEGCIALYYASQSYRNDSEAKFSTYAYILIKRRIIHKYREYLRPLKYEKYSYNAVKEVDYLSYYTDNSERCDLNEICSWAFDFMNSLSELDRTIVRMRQNKASYKDISSSTSLTLKQVDNRLYRIRKCYRTFLENKKEEVNDSSYPIHCKSEFRPPPKHSGN